MMDTDHLFGYLVRVDRATSDGSDGVKFPLIRTPCYIGRDADCQIRLKNPDICERHCMLKVSQRKNITVHSLDSNHAVLVNGIAVNSDGYRLKNDDVIQISDVRFRWSENKEEEKSKNSARLSFCSENPTKPIVAQKIRWSDPGFVSDENEDNVNTDVREESLIENDDSEASARVNQNKSVCSVSHVPLNDEFAKVNQTDDAELENTEIGDSHPNEIMNESVNSTGSNVGNVSDIDLVIPDEGVGRASQQTDANVLNSSSKIPKVLDEAEVSGFDFLPSSQSQECDTVSKESVVLGENADPNDHGDDVELTIPEHVTPPKSVENIRDACNSSMKKDHSTPVGRSNDKSRLQRTPESSARSIKRLREDTPTIAESPSKFRGRRSTGILPCVGTPSDVYRIKRSLMATPAMRSSRSTVSKEAETSSTSRQPRRRSSERKSTPLKPRVSDRCIQRESVLYSPIIEDAASEKCEESQNESVTTADPQFRYVQTRRKRRFGGSTFAEENKILEESETSQNTTVGTCENTNADGDNEEDDESLMTLNLCDDSSAPMSARIVINGDQDAAENSSDIKDELNSTFTVDSAETLKENSLAVEPQQTLKSILTPLAKMPSLYKEKSAKKVTFACNVIAESSNESSVDCTLQSTDSYNSTTRHSLRSSVDSASLCSQIEEGLDSFCQNEELFSEISRSSSVFSRNSTSTPVKSPRKSSLNSLRLKNVARSLNDWGDVVESDRSSAISQAEESMDDNVDLTELQEAEKEQCSGLSLTKTSGDRSTNSMSHEFATPTCSKLVDSLGRRSNSYLPDYTSEENDDESGSKIAKDSTIDFDKTVDCTTNAFHSRKVTTSTGVTPLLNQMKLNQTTNITGTPFTKFNVTTESAKRVSCDVSTMAEKSVASFAGTPCTDFVRSKSERSFSFISLNKEQSEPSSKSDVSTKAVAGTDDSEETRSETTASGEVDVSCRKSSRLNSSRLSQIGRTPTSSKNTPYSTRTRRSSKTEYLEETLGTRRAALDLKSPGLSKTTTNSEDVLLTDSNETTNDTIGVGDLLKTPRRTMEAKRTPQSRLDDTVVTESTTLKSAESQFEPEAAEEAETQDVLGTEGMEEAETQNILNIEEAETQNILDIEDVDTQIIDERWASPKMSATNVVEAEKIKSTPEPEIMEEALTQLVTEKVAAPAAQSESTDRFSVQDEEVEESQYLSARFSHESHVMEDDETQDVCALSEKQNASAVLLQAVEDDAETQDVVTHHSSEVAEDAETQDVCALLPQSSEGDEMQAPDLDEPELFSQSIEEYKTQDISNQTPSRKASTVEEITEQNAIEEGASQNIFEDVDVPEAVEKQNSEDVVVRIDETETQDLVDERMAEVEETQTLQDEVVEIAGTQDLLDERMAGAETQCLFDEEIAEAETQILQDEIVDEAETQMLPDEIVDEVETQYPLDEGILEAETQYLLDQGIVQAETQVLQDQVVDEAETQDLLDEMVDEAETQDLLDERIPEGETHEVRDEIVDGAETQDLLDERIADGETQAVLRETIVDVEQIQDLLDELVEEAATQDLQTQDLLEEGIEKIEMPALIEENASQIPSNSSIQENEITPMETLELDNAETETKASDVAEEPVAAESSEPSTPSAEVTSVAKLTDVPNERTVESVDAARPEVAKEEETPTRAKPNEPFVTPRPPRIQVTYHGTESPDVRRSSRISHRRASKTPSRLDLGVEKSASKRTKKDRDNQENEDCSDIFHRRCSMCALNVSEPVSARKRQRNDDEATPVPKRKRTPYKMDDGNETVTKTELQIPKLGKTQVDAETQTIARRSSPFRATTPASEKKHRVLKKLDENSEQPSSTPHTTIVLPVRQFNSTGTSPIKIEIPLTINVGTENDTPAPSDTSLPTAINKEVVSAKRKRESKKHQNDATVEASALTQTVHKVPSPAAPAKPTRQQKASDTSDGLRTTSAAVAMNDAAPTTQRASNDVASSPPKVAQTSSNKRGAKKTKIAPISPAAPTPPQAASPKRTTRKRRNADADLASIVSPPKRTLRNRATNVVQSPAATVVEKKSKRGGGAVAAVVEPKGRTATRTKTAVVQPTVQTVVEAVVEQTTDVKRAIRPKRFASPAEVQKKAIRGARQKAAEKAPPATSSRRPVSVEEETQPEPSQRSTRTKRGAAAVAQPPAEPEIPSAKRRAGKPAAATSKSVPATSDAQLEKKSSTRTRTKKLPEENEPEPEPKTKPTRGKSRAKRAPVVDSIEEEAVEAPEPEPKTKSTRSKGGAKRAAVAIVDSSDEEPAQKSTTRGGRTTKRTSATKATKKNETAASSRGPSLTISRKSLTLKTVKFKSPIAHVKSSSDEEPRKKRAKTVQKANEEATNSKTKSRRSVKVVVGRSVTSTSKSSSRKTPAKDEVRESPTVPTVTRGARTRASTRVSTKVASTSRTTRRKQ